LVKAHVDNGKGDHSNHISLTDDTEKGNSFYSFGIGLSLVSIQVSEYNILIPKNIIHFKMTHF
jgi:hypothetical protein